MEGVIVRATREQIKSFKESLLWKDMVRELGIWKTACKEEPMAIVADAQDSNPSTAAVLMHLGDIHGRVKSVDFILNLPDLFLNILEEQKDDDKR